MRLYYEGPGVAVHHGDCIEVMRTLPDASVHAVVTDPPYALEFMGRGWDKYTPLEFEAWCAQWATEALRVLKPGGHMLTFGGSRTWHRLAAGIEDAGFEMRDSIAWLYGSGFPKSLNLEGEWEGWGTALKPAFEPIAVARKPLVGTVARNVLEHGTGALNIDGTRIGTSGGRTVHTSSSGDHRDRWEGNKPTGEVTENGGRWPTNVILDGSQADALDAQSGTFAGVSGGMRQVGGKVTFHETMGERKVPEGANPKRFERGTPDYGGASRFFPVFRYEAKAPTDERPNVDGVQHPTVKPLDLMRWLVRLVTPKDGTILEPFAGSGTTLEAALLEGFNVIGIEREAEYLPLIEARITKPLQVAMF
jgi:site-specific DNA-methyltransferase (adenine-specific)